MEKKEFVKELINFRKKIYSQNDEDGILLEIFNRIGTTNKYFIEFGAWDGKHLSNTANLRINHGWNGLLLEGDKGKCNELIKHAFITSENINSIFEQYNVPSDFDLLSIDIDSDDYYCWEACNYNPRVVIIEFNPLIDPLIPLVAANRTSKFPECWGASLSAMKNLGNKKGYSLIFRSNQQNLIFVKTDLLNENEQNIPIENFINKNNLTIKYPPPNPYNHWNEYADNMLWQFYNADLNNKNWILL